MIRTGRWWSTHKNARVNHEGLTLHEWLVAAGIDYDENQNQNLELHVTGASAPVAWRRGEDPTEWRAEAQGGVVL